MLAMQKKQALFIGSIMLLVASHTQAAVISPLTGTTETNQLKLGEWFSRYSDVLTAAQLQALKSAPASSSSSDLKATASTMKVTYLGTGAARDANLFLASAGTGAFNTANFWNPIYASGGTNNLNKYNPVNSTDALFESRAGCSYGQAKAGNSCIASQLELSRQISGLTVGDNLVFGLQALNLVYGKEVNLPNTNYFFTGPVANNSDSKGWADKTVHTHVLTLADGSYMVGFEDTWAGKSSDSDYNDMVFLLSPVPEPETYVMMLSGLGLLLAGARKRRNQKVAVPA